MFKKFAAAAALAFVASSAFAAPTAFYAGLDVGSTKVDGLSDNKASFGGFLGYGFNQYVAAEVGYRQHGTWNVDGADVKFKETHVSVVGSYPLNAKLDVYGRLGYSSVKAEASSMGYSASSDSTGNTVIGAGLSYTFAPNISARLEVQKPSSDTTNVGVGVVYKF
jgi:hypothetical protein